MKSNKSNVTELVPRATVPDLEGMLNRLVEAKVAEALASDSAVLRPFFETRRVTTELRKLQSVVEQRKWKYYYERHGCIDCKTKLEAHYGIGMCQNCHRRTASRMIALLRELNAARPAVDEPKDLQALARTALAPAIEVLAKKKVGRPTSKTWMVKPKP